MAQGGVSQGGRNLMTVVALLLVSFCLYYKSGDFDFIYYDDVRILAEHPELYNGPSFADSVRAVFTLVPREEPLLLRDLSWVIDSRLFGFGNPHGYHFINVVLHSVVVGLCFLTLLQITRRYEVAVLTALCVAGLAVNVEPVAWIMGRKDLLVAFWGFLALMCHSRALDAPSRWSRNVCYGGSWLAVTFALFSKISAFVFPAMLFLLALFQPALRRSERSSGGFSWRCISQALLSVLPHGLVSLVVFLWYRGVLNEFGVFNRGYTATAFHHLGNLLVLNPLTWLRELQLLLFPWDMPFLHSWPGTVEHFGFWYVLVAVTVWMSLIVLGYLVLQKRRDVAFYGVVFFVLMVPYMNIQYIGIWVANRYLYFSSFCVMAVLVTLTLDAWATRARPIAWAAAILLFCVLANNVRCLIETLPRWRNAETLWESELRRSNPTPDEFYSLASFYYTQALRTADPVAREKLYQKTESLVARAKPLYDKPYLALQNLLLLDALIAIGRNAPEEQRLVTLLRAEQVGPGNDAILWQLMLFYYKKALPLAEGAQRNELARKALGYYLRYREVSPRAAGFVVKDQAIQAEFRSDFPALGPDFGKIK